MSTNPEWTDLVVCSDCGKECPRRYTTTQPCGFIECSSCRAIRRSEEQDAYMRMSGRTW